MMIISSSAPWKPSTDFTFTEKPSYISQDFPSFSWIALTCALYGDTIPTDSLVLVNTDSGNEQKEKKDGTHGQPRYKQFRSFVIV
jgi:hypothetical protein